MRRRHDQAAAPARAGRMPALTRHRVADGQRGAATAETVLVIPVVLLLVLLILQYAVWQHGVHVARAAAEQGLAVARVQDGTAEGGRSAAEQMLQRAGPGLLVSPVVRVERGATTVTVRVDATAEQVLPGLRLPVHALAVGASEPATPPSGTGGP